MDRSWHDSKIDVMMRDIDCLIIGAGPTGLTLGLGLAKAGKTVVIAEKHVQALGFSRAMLVSSDSLKSLEALGVSRMIRKAGALLDGFSCFVDETLVSSCQFDLADPTHPVVLPQESTEKCLAELFLQHGGIIMHGYAFDADKLTVDDIAPLQVTLRPSKDSPSKEVYTLRCQWLFGCDGTHSAVRSALGIGYTGSTVSEQRNYVMDLIVEDWPYDNMFTMWFEAADSGLVLKLSSDPLLIRIVGTTERACQCLARKFSIQSVVWDSHYISSYKLASSYGRGNVWLAGDACHVHSPLGGRGMNTGIADAVALASAVAANDLTQYEAQRRPVARNWVWTNYFLSQIAMGRGAGFYAVRYVLALAIRGLAFLLGQDFAVLSFSTITTSLVKRLVVAAAADNSSTANKSS
jgi:2-polyprenyl-6-methoxyphenol hydroxylase-like FAD-dependent oxidoreductase